MRVCRVRRGIITLPSYGVGETGETSRDRGPQSARYRHDPIAHAQAAVLLYDSNGMEKSGRGSVAAWSRCRSRHAVWVLGWV